MKHAESVTFGGSGLDRAAHLRKAPPKGDVVAFWQGKPLLQGDGDAPVPVFLPSDHAIFNDATEPSIFLGLDDGTPRYARDISAWDPSDDSETIGAFDDPSEQRHPDVAEAVFGEMRANMMLLSRRSAEVLATAKALIEWHRSHGFCARCGTASVMAMAGWQRDCAACGGHHFPRTDPVVIMLITRANSVLMGRSPNWPEGMFSLLAGFVEPGETIEAAVRREVFEEAGVTVGDVGYLASQPWPFPGSLMFGCEGQATSEEITIDPVEIEAARWVNREEMMQAMAGESPDMLPARKGSIARFLLENWLADTLD